MPNDLPEWWDDALRVAGDVRRVETVLENQAHQDLQTDEEGNLRLVGLSEQIEQAFRTNANNHGFELPISPAYSSWRISYDNETGAISATNAVNATESPMPLNTGILTSKDTFVTTFLVPKILNRIRRNGLSFSVGIDPTNANRAIVLGTNIRLTPETKRCPGTSLPILANAIGRISVEADVPHNQRIGGIKYKKLFSVDADGRFAVTSISDFIEYLLNNVSLNAVTPEPTEAEINVMESKAQAKKASLVVLAEKRVANYEKLTSVLSSFTVESSKEDEFFNVKLANNMRVRVDAVPTGAVIREVTIPADFDLDYNSAALVKLLTDLASVR